MRIKEKTTLRKWIKDSIGTTGELDIIWFYEDGSWQETSSNTIIPDTLGYKIRDLARALPGSEYEFLDGKKYLDAIITENFREIERILNKRSGENEK